MRHLYFKPDGKLWIKAKRPDPDLEAQYPNPIVVEDNFELLIEDLSVEVEGGMPTARRQKTRSEIESELDYKIKRKTEYPPIEDYLDGVVKSDQAQIDSYIAACQAVKDKYPKPE